MANFDAVFKDITSRYPSALAALALKTPDVEVGDRLNTEHITVRIHQSDMTFHIELPDEDAILHIEAQTDESRHRPMPSRMLAYSSFLFREFSPPAGIVSKPYNGGTHARICFLRTRPATRC